jgi:hypothetical protein
VKDKATPSDKLTPKQAAREFHLTARTFRDHCNLPPDHPLHLKHLRTVAGRILLERTDIEEWFRRKEAHRQRLRQLRNRGLLPR